MDKQHPTADLALNILLDDLTSSIHTALGDNLVGAYLQGSFAVGDWDLDSDVDFLIAIDHEASDTELSTLQAIHGRLYDLESNWAKHLEGAYFPKDSLRRRIEPPAQQWFLNNTSRELIRSAHDNTQVVRWIVREYGISLYGPPPNSLIDPISAHDLRQEIMKKMHNWSQEIFANPDELNNGWYQPYVVLSFCRMLHTLQTARVGSKLAGAHWAKGALDPHWKDLIQRAWDERPNPTLKAHQEANLDDVKHTLDFVQYALLTTTKPGYLQEMPNQS